MARILIMEDDNDIGDVIGILLEMANHIVQKVSTGKEIETLLSTFKPSLILIDVLLNGEDGRKICADIKALHQDVAILLMSASTGALHNFVDHCADGVIHKPFDITDFKNKVDDVLHMQAVKNFTNPA